MKIQIINRIDREFGMVPRALWSMRLPFTAKALAAYLFCLRDGAAPYVAEIEDATGLGRDARRKAFAALEAAGVIAWHIARNERGAITAKTLCVDPSACLAPENQAHGEIHHAPEKPAGGFPVDASTEIRPSTACGSGDNKEKERKKERAAKARAAAGRRSPPDGGGVQPLASDTTRSDVASVDLGALSVLQRDQIRRGASVLVAGAVVAAFSPEMAALQAALAQAERGEVLRKAVPA